MFCLSSIFSLCGISIMKHIYILVSVFGLARCENDVIGNLIGICTV